MRGGIWILTIQWSCNDWLLPFIDNCCIFIFSLHTVYMFEWGISKNFRMCNCASYAENHILLSIWSSRLDNSDVMSSEKRHELQFVHRCSIIYIIYLLHFCLPVSPPDVSHSPEWAGHINLLPQVVFLYHWHDKRFATGMHGHCGGWDHRGWEPA